MIRLEPMTAEEFRASRDRGVARHSADQVRRGIWSEKAAEEAGRSEFAEHLPQGHATPDFRFCHVVEVSTGSRVGETWYIIRARGGKTQAWIDWIWVDPSHRRRGYATYVFRWLEQEAARLGADRIGLNVLADNEGALALYEKLGYRATSFRLSKPLPPLPT
ncbi:MAG: GNAT family N-acetyltransferase [Thermoplasmata archaeon]|nr:GNAT family N-acetyltransferase [Thermoplasmata archaeon]